MRSPGSLAAYTVQMVMVALLMIGGLVQIASPSGSTLLGIVLIIVASGLSGYARNARAEHLHEEKMKGLWHWAQGLGPRSRQGRTRR